MQSVELTDVLGRVNKLNNKVATVKNGLTILESKYGKAVLKFLYENNELHSKHIGEQFDALGLRSQNVYKCIGILEKVGLLTLTLNYPSARWTFETGRWIAYVDNVNNLSNALEGVEADTRQLIKQTEEGEVMILDLKQYKRVLECISCLSEKRNVIIITTLLDDAVKKTNDSVGGMMNKEFSIRKFGEPSTVSKNLSRMAKYKIVDRVADMAIDGRLVRNSINLDGLKRLLSFIENHHFQNKASRRWRPQKAVKITRIRPNIPLPQQS